MKYTRFEDLPCWQRARELCQAVFGLISSGPFSRDFGLKDQNHFEEVIGSLSEMPERGHYPPELERLGIYQYLEIHLRVYRIIYRVIRPDVFVHAVLDGRRDIQELLYQRLIRHG
jgi:hypothetical protein